MKSYVQIMFVIIVSAIGLTGTILVVLEHNRTPQSDFEAHAARVQRAASHTCEAYFVWKKLNPDISHPHLEKVCEKEFLK